MFDAETVLEDRSSRAVSAPISKQIAGKPSTGQRQSQFGSRSHDCDSYFSRLPIFELRLPFFQERRDPFALIVEVAQIGEQVRFSASALRARSRSRRLTHGPHGRPYRQLALLSQSCAPSPCADALESSSGGTTCETSPRALASDAEIEVAGQDQFERLGPAPRGGSAVEYPRSLE